jgi:UPF0755 protein
MYIKRILWAVALMGLIAMGAFAWYVYDTVFSPNTAFNNAEAHVYIPTNATFQQVVDELEPLLEDVSAFAAVAQRKGYTANIKPGHFIIRKGMNNNELINTIRSRNIPIDIRFNNQERLEDLAGHVAQQIEADSISLIEAMRDTAFLESVGLSEETALAMYIPNTYEMYWNSSAKTFRDRMKTEYERFWNESRQKKANNLNLTREEVMALAAIVQKETAKPEERPRVAGVYVNRLRRGMLLQADPTVIYAKKKAENDFNQIIKRVLYADLELDSPYNTYKYAGIPPGLIAMPDISAIDAVLNPENHEYLFFVADIENFGYHKFAKTLAQHNRNKAEYVRWISRQGVKR